MSKSEFELRIWDPGELDIVPNLLEIMFAAHGNPQTNTIEKFLWKHRDNPAGPSIFSYAIDPKTDILVATEAMSPRSLVFNNQKYLGFESNDTSTRPEYGRRGLFTSLLKFCMVEAERRGATFLYGLPNLNSKSGFSRYGIRSIGGIKNLAKPLRFFRTGYGFIKSYKANLKYIDGYWENSLPKKNTHTLPNNWEFMLEAREGWRGVWAGDRNQAYLIWRFLKNPHFNYQIVNSDEDLGIVALGRRGILREARIVEIFFKSHNDDLNKNIKKLLQKINILYKPDFVSTIMTIHNPYFQLLHKAGFLNVPSRMMFFGYPFYRCPQNLTDAPWALTGADIDTQ